MRPRTPRQMVIVIPHLERVRHLDVLQRPASVIVLEVARAVLKPDKDVALRLLPNLEWVDVTAVLRSWMPLNAGEAANAREYAAELVRLLPCGVECTDASGRVTGDGAAVPIRPQVVSLRRERQYLLEHEARVSIV